MAKGRVAFLHPDLGIGGAERLVVDAAVALQDKGYEVSIVTGYHDPKRAFPETIDGTLKVTRVGQWLPRSICGRFVAFCAYLKMILAALYLRLFSQLNPQVVVCDQVSACIPFLRARINPFSKTPQVMYYCHFPDQLLTGRDSLSKKVYRYPIDFIEEWTTNSADHVVVNSEFTASVFSSTFPKYVGSPGVLYPSINTDYFDQVLEENGIENLVDIPRVKYLFVSINRFEPPKDIAIAIRSLNHLRMCLTRAEWEDVHLVLMGGFDPRLQASVKYLTDLKNLVAKEKMENHVSFILSPPNHIKINILARSTALVYTPSFEHFGIVPLEAMYLSKPVIAVDSGGPRETVVNERTGFLCPAIDQHFGVAMARLVKDAALTSRLGEAGRKRFLEHFSFEKFAKNWDESIERLLRRDVAESVDVDRKKGGKKKRN